MPVIGNTPPLLRHPSLPDAATPQLPEPHEAELEHLERLDHALDFAPKNRDGYAEELHHLLASARLDASSWVTEDPFVLGPVIRMHGHTMSPATKEAHPENFCLHDEAEVLGALEDGEAGNNCYYVRLGEDYFAVTNLSGFAHERTVEVSPPMQWDAFAARVESDVGAAMDAR